MQNWTAFPQQNRSDRVVRRSRLYLGAGVSRQRATVLLEEALRLTSLPGEDQGRTYYFRRFRLHQIAANAGRNVWLDRIQAALGELARRAVHGADPRASSAEAVFFESQQEAFEQLLRKIARFEYTNEWFWSMVAATPNVSTRSEQAVSLIERLRLLPSSWHAVSRAIFAEMSDEDTESLLEIVPHEHARLWLRELGEQTGAEITARPLRLSRATGKAVLRAVHRFGVNDTRTIWLAVLALIHDAPIEIQARNLIAKARSSLNYLASDSLWISETIPGARSDTSKTTANLPDSHPMRFDETLETFSSTPSASSSPSQPTSSGLSLRASRTEEMRASFAPGRFVHGEPTEAGGLFFLLVVAERLGIVSALESGLAEIHPGFVPALLANLANLSGVPDSDPVLLWLKELRFERQRRIADGVGLEEPKTYAMQQAYWPRNLKLATGETVGKEFLMRVWSLGVRRYCRRECGIPVPEIILRTATLSASSADLDVVLLLSSVDIRIRRAGLDLDPGWLSWFGRVGRFHYTQSAPGICV